MKQPKQPSRKPLEVKREPGKPDAKQDSDMQPDILASDLANFLMDSLNTVSREVLLTRHLLYDLELAAAARGYALQTFMPHVDREGFDVILDDGDEVKRLQLKSVVVPASTSTWDVHRRLLRPHLDFIEQLGYESSPAGAGLGGGLLLIVCTPREASLDVEYKYTDAWLLTALELGILSSKPDVQKCCLDIRAQLQTEPSGKIKIPRKVLLTAKTPEHLLALMGLHSRINCSFQLNLLDLAKHHFMDTTEPLPTPAVRQYVGGCIADLVKENVAQASQPAP